nr:cytochrome P450 71A6-like [Coffea arabica]
MLPVVGNLHQLGLLPHRSMQSLSKKYGPVMLLHFGNKPILVASSASAASESMKNHDQVFSNRQRLSIARRLFYGSKDVAFSPYGEYWRQLRSILVHQLLSNKMVQSFRRVREEETSLVIGKIKVALGRKYGDGEHGRKAKDTLAEFIQILGIDQFIEGVIEEHRNKAVANTTETTCSHSLDILLQIQREKLFAIEHDSIKAVILDMFEGGTDTTHTIMEWAMAELPRHPKILMQLQNEVRQKANVKSEITEDDLDKMQCLKAVIKDVLRLHAPVPLLLARESTQDAKVMGYDSSAEGVAQLSVFALAINEPALAKLVHKFDFELPDGAKREELDMCEVNDRSIVDAASGGALVNKTSREAWELIEGMAENSQQFDKRKDVSMHRVNKIETFSIQQQLTELTSFIR